MNNVWPKDGCFGCLQAGQPFVAVALRGGMLAGLCEPCYALCRAASLRWRDTWTCQECGSVPRDGLRQIFDLAYARRGVYRPKLVCARCRNAWWAQVQAPEPWGRAVWHWIVFRWTSLALWLAVRHPISP